MNIKLLKYIIHNKAALEILIRKHSSYLLGHNGMKKTLSCVGFFNNDMLFEKLYEVLCCNCDKCNRCEYFDGNEILREIIYSVFGVRLILAHVKKIHMLSHLSNDSLRTLWRLKNESIVILHR
nr:MAG: hypothetical protein [Helarchaeota virus Nidhogg Meg22_1012]URC17441.1 MAG: hypothetical protein [Helarchaeota virus Nidhogg Meg22_1214]